jgi:hypothetical protein
MPDRFPIPGGIFPDIKFPSSDLEQNKRLACPLPPCSILNQNSQKGRFVFRRQIEQRNSLGYYPDFGGVIWTSFIVIKV